MFTPEIQKNEKKSYKEETGRKATENQIKKQLERQPSSGHCGENSDPNDVQSQHFYAFILFVPTFAAFQSIFRQPNIFLWVLIMITFLIESNRVEYNCSSTQIYLTNNWSLARSMCSLFGTSTQ